MGEGVREVGLGLPQREVVVPRDAKRVDAARGTDEVLDELLEELLGVADGVLRGKEVVEGRLGPREGAVEVPCLDLVTAANGERRRVDWVARRERHGQAVRAQDAAGDVERLQPVVGREPRAEVEPVVVGASRVDVPAVAAGGG